MNTDVLRQCQDAIGYCFKDPDLLSLALTHASNADTRLESNERLEFLGDSVLGLAVCEELYRTRSDLLEGEMTRIKSAVVSRETCAEVAEEMGLDSLLSLGKGMPAGDLPRSVSAAVIESILGAVYLDGGYEAARKLVIDWMGPYLSEEAGRDAGNYKSLLQQHAQRHWGLTPEYRVLDEKGPDHDKCFEVAVSANGRVFPSAWGKSKKQAEQNAARRAMEEISADRTQPDESGTS